MLTVKFHLIDKMCVPEELLASCEEMAKQTTKSAAKIVCIPARDRMVCIEKVKERLADFVQVDPEDMYVAGELHDEDFAVFEQIRTLDEPEAEFRFEAVVVVHKDLDITNLTQLKGLKSCHTGVGRNVGYKVPLTKLKNMGIIGKLNEPELSLRENELKAFSNLFSKACIVGKWSADEEINKIWKKRYSNLCAMCEEPEKCDYPDNYSGYEGALRCLAHNGGQVAWTKVIFVRRFFGLPVGVTTSKPTKENSDNFAYLCPDGTKVPVTSDTPCTWAARPWQGYMMNTAMAKTADELGKKIENLDVLGHKTHADWLKQILEIGDNDVAHETKPISPKKYLNKARYADVIEREYGPPVKTIKFCVVSEDELQKCQEFSKATFSRNVRPRFTCVQKKTVEDCMAAIKDDAADIITLDGGLVDKAQREYELKPVVAETYGPSGGSYYAVAVVRKNSQYQSFAELRGAKSCHTGVGRTAGYNAPLYTLVKLNLIAENNCPHPAALSEFFSGGSCLPGAKEPTHNLLKDNVDKLCSLCAGNKDNNDATTKCNFDSSEAYSGYTGAFRCLIEGGGDVAFVKHVTVPGNSDGKNLDKWAANLNSTDYELLCPQGGRAPVDQYKRCYLAHAPPHMVVTRKSKSDEDVEEIQNALLSASEMYTKRPDWFKMFGSFNGKKDLLFKDSATGLFSIHGESEVAKEYAKILSVVNKCK